MEEKLIHIINEMAEYLSIAQLKKLQEVLLKAFSDETKTPQRQEIDNFDYLKLFQDAKRIEGCSVRTIGYYQTTIEHMLLSIHTSVRKITTEEVRAYLVEYQKIKSCRIENIKSVVINHEKGTAIPVAAIQ